MNVRIGLFELDKRDQTDRTVGPLADVLDRIGLNKGRLSMLLTEGHFTKRLSG